jgi:hypothetical protein
MSERVEKHFAFSTTDEEFYNDELRIRFEQTWRSLFREDEIILKERWERGYPSGWRYVVTVEVDKENLFAHEPDTYKEVTCSGCGSNGPATVDGLLKNGWLLRPFDFGYWMGFSDMFEGDMRWNICHDCVLSFFDTFPRLAAQHPRALHEYGKEPCCEFGWGETR